MMEIIDHLPYVERPDLSPFLIHLTKNTKTDNECSAFDNLVSILKAGHIWASDKKGFIKGTNGAACFMDVPFMSLKYVLNKETTNPDHPKYEPFGIVVTKRTAYSNGARPVLYLSDQETKEIGVSREELWRVVRFDGVEIKEINWTHEREWRAKGNFVLPSGPIAALVKNQKDAKKLSALIKARPTEFKSKPQSIIPLNIVCQGLIYI